MTDTAPIEHPSWLTGGDFTAADEPFRLFAEWFAEGKRAEPVNPDAMALATVDADGMPATTAWTPDGQPVSVRRNGAAGKATVEVGTELGRVMAEASYRATAAISGAQQGWERVVDRSRKRFTRRGDED